MIEVRPDNLDGAVIFNVDVLDVCAPTCKLCVDFSVGIHNWLLNNEVPYIIIDFQDEKDVCSIFLEEMVHLRKRALKPFYFVGMMPKVEEFLNEFGVLSQTKVALSPEMAIADLKKSHKDVFLTANLADYELGQPIRVSKARLQHHIGASASTTAPTSVEEQAPADVEL